MTKMTLRELQLFSLEILKDVHKFCVENRIPYSVSDGTLIGAVRHKGFIPWDDDIDIIMRRPDFNRFVRIYKSSNFGLKYRELNDDSLVPYARVYDNKRTLVKAYSPWCEESVGVCIDIFPVDGVPDDMQNCLKYYKKSRFFFRCNTASRSAPSKFNCNKSAAFNIKLLAKKILFLNGLTTDWFSRKVIQRAKAIEFGKSNYWGNLSSMCDGIMDHHRNETFSDIVLLDFENTKVMAMNGYEEYLRDKYRDFMQLPPVEKRVSHLMKAYDFYWI